MANTAIAPQATTQGGAQNQNSVPFRRATLARVDTLPPENALAFGSARIPLERTIEGSGFVYGVMLECVATTTGNAATVAFAEDAPFNVLDNVVFKDVNGEIINLGGYDLYISNLCDKQYTYRFQDQSSLYVATTGVGSGSGGSFDFWLRVPVATNRRDLIGLLGNQDRAQKYQLRTDVAASTSVYTTPPTTLPTLTINKLYENYAVPLAQGAAGASQMQVPPTFGVLHFTTKTVSDASPVPGQLNHYLRRIGNTIRWIALVFRSNGSRSSAQTNAPTNIQFKVGDDTQFTESYNYRRAIMYERYGFDFPNGVLVYDAMHDFSGFAGAELGDDYWHTQAITQAQFLITYPAGFGSTNNTLTFITDDLLYQRPVVGMTSVVAGR